MNEAQLLEQITIRNRISYRSNQEQNQRIRDRIQEHTGIILDYDPSGSSYAVQTTDGRVVAALAISNSSALCLGASVSLVTPTGSAIPIIDAMPL